MSTSRRRFLAGLTAASYSRVLGANDRVQVGFIGYGLIGAQHVHDFKNQRDADLAAMCDVYQPRLEAGVAACGGTAKGYSDFRKMLENKDLQAIVVSTPDHWHALMTILACQAGKDVYVEKPLTLFIAEGQWMTKAARRFNRVVQAGTQQRSGLHYQKARQLIRDGYLGKVHSIRIGSYRNITPGFGMTPDEPVPPGFDYNMWLGPAPERPFNPKRGLYHFRWFWDYSGGQQTNLGMHQMDIVQWFLNATGPKAVSSSGGRFVLEDNGETPDTQNSLFEYPNCNVEWSHREGSSGPEPPSGAIFLGTKGYMQIYRDGFQIVPDKKQPPTNLIPTFQGHPDGGPKKVETEPELWTKPMKEPGSSQEQFDLHVRNFLDCIKSRQRPIADVEGAHRVATACHLANISYRTGRKLRWDVEKEQIIDDPQANAYLVRPYRKPWDAELRSVGL